MVTNQYVNKNKQSVHWHTSVLVLSWPLKTKQSTTMVQKGQRPKSSSAQVRRVADRRTIIEQPHNIFSYKIHAKQSCRDRNNHVEIKGRRRVPEDRIRDDRGHGPTRAQGQLVPVRMPPLPLSPERLREIISGELTTGSHDAPQEIQLQKTPIPHGRNDRWPHEIESQHVGK